MSALLTIEEGGVCQGELGFLRNFYRLGVRMMTLTWNYPNELAFPNKREMQENGCSRLVADTENGLTETGVRFVREMERLGMIIDISHLNDAGIWDVFRHTKKPFVASHSNARAVASHARNLTDEMIRALAERGGVVGINYYSCFLHDFAEGESAVSYTHLDVYKRQDDHKDSRGSDRNLFRCNGKCGGKGGERPEQPGQHPGHL